MNTLKQRHALNKKHTQNLKTLTEKCKKIDECVLNEARELQIIIEAINQKSIQNIIQVSKKLQQVDFSAFPSIKQVVDKAIQQLNLATASGKNVKDTNWIGMKTPVGKALKLAVDIEKGLEGVGQVISQNSKDVKAIANNKVSDVLKTPEAQQALQQTFKRGFFQRNGSLGGIADNIASDINRATVQNVANMIRSLKQTNVVNVMDDILNAAGDGQAPEAAAQAAPNASANAAPSAASAAPTPATASAAPTNTGTAGTGSTSGTVAPATNDEQEKKQLGADYSKYKQAGSAAGVSATQAQKVIQAYQRAVKQGNRQRQAPKTQPDANPAGAQAA